MKIEISDAHIANEVIFTLSAESENEVNEWEEAVKVAGGKIVSKAQKFGEGIMVLYFLTLMVINLMCFTCRRSGLAYLSSKV
ncbi:hypothetical protein [Pedobacter steynii]